MGIRFPDAHVFILPYFFSYRSIFPYFYLYPHIFPLSTLSIPIFVSSTSISLQFSDINN
ncbi:hypothetical protein CLOSTHATH_00552 [Hungatella hathewayi DSM 13479]|uniref:Uncharacterized protein n=1 Tax=Hungatella hathewayi DSM 13479 TaxID=566550 RepID=D3AAD1_9FIRM|nr:hypothetical protein CLOSTHATH_00552 [Hungatella hathewayi DSM 13479]